MKRNRGRGIYRSHDDLVDVEDQYVKESGTCHIILLSRDVVAGGGCELLKPDSGCSQPA